jgi:hypothetical protein
MSGASAPIILRVRCFHQAVSASGPGEGRFGNGLLRPSVRNQTSHARNTL